jgi:serine/threonine protein kinase/tetratricopeptide (TPR) repeat protein
MLDNLIDEKDVFNRARQIATPEGRTAYLQEACAQDPAAMQRILELIRVHEQEASFLESSPVVRGVTIDEPGAERPGTVIGPYKLLQQIGEGGMGTVFMAEQTQPVQRKIALKIIKPGLDSRQVVARFEAERQALALMDHPHIARVLDGGTTQSNRPYFVMELVRGVPITRYCDEHRLTPRQRLELFVPVCQAVQHAHQKGIIHRDLKPSNVLVAEYDDKPVAKVIDFGVAKATGPKLTEQTMFTEFGQVVGTLEYMSPEQAKLNALDIDTRSDIYALGVLLYELLTGTTPFDTKRLHEAAFDEMLRIIREEEPPRPSTRLGTTQKLPSVAANRGMEPKTLSGLVRGELDWIVMKCLEKDRNRRYETANGLWHDIEHFLRDEPVQACPPSAWYRFRKFSRRYKGPLLAGALVLLALIGGIVGTTWGMIRAEAARRDAVAAQAAEAERAEGERQAKQQALEREAETNAVLDFVENQVFAAARPKDQDGGQGYDVKLVDVVRAALPLVDKSFTGQPLIEARLRTTMGTLFWYVGESAIAIEQFQAARQLYTRHRGFDHPDTLSSMHNLAVSYAPAGRIHEALKLHEETLQLRKAKLGPDHSDTLWSMHGLASSYTDVGRFQEALKLHEETLQLRKVKLGPDHPDTLWSMDGLANTYAAAGRMREALKLHEQTLQLRKAKLGPDHRDTLGSMQGLASSYADTGHIQEALKLRRETLQLLKAKLGPDHPETLWSMDSLANSCADAGQIQEALKLHEETLQLRKTKLGLDHPDTLASMNGLASSYVDVGRPQEALKLRQETFQLLKAKLGPDHRETLASMNGLAISYADAGRLQEALKLHEETLQLRKAKLGLDHPDTLWSMNNLACTYVVAGRNQEAIKLHEETLQLRKGKLGPDHPDTLKSMINLAASYTEAGRILEALKLHEVTLRLCKAKFGPDHPSTLASMNNLAACYADSRRIQEALKLHEQTLRLRKTKLGPDHPDTLASMNNLASVYAESGRLREALKIREETLQLFKAKLGPNHPRTQVSMHNLASCYADSGRFQEALKLDEETLQLRKATLGPDHPDTLESMNSLAGSYIAVGKAARAMATLQETLALRERRVKAAPDNSVELSGLARTHGQMGAAEQSRQNFAAAVKAYARALEILDKLDHAGQLKLPSFRGMRSTYRVQLTLCRIFAALDGDAPD